MKVIFELNGVDIAPPKREAWQKKKPTIHRDIEDDDVSVAKFMEMRKLEGLSAGRRDSEIITLCLQKTYADCLTFIKSNAMSAIKDKYPLLFVEGELRKLRLRCQILKRNLRMPWPQM